MTKVTGVVEYQPRANKYGFYSLRVNGTYYSCGKTDPGINKGQSVAFDAEQNEKGYWDIKGDVTTSGAAPAPSGGGSKKGGYHDRPFPLPPRHGDRVIVRQNALAHATGVVSALVDLNDKVTDAGMAERVVTVARIFEAYACGDDERRKDEAKLAAKLAAEMAQRAVDGE